MRMRWRDRCPSRRYAQSLLLLRFVADLLHNQEGSDDDNDSKICSDKLQACTAVAKGTASEQGVFHWQFGEWVVTVCLNRVRLVCSNCRHNNTCRATV